MKIKIYNLEGKATGEMEIPDAMFGVEVIPELVHEAIVIQEANARKVLAHTKDRSEVRGGGRKPWKQKGTGRARHGSRRSPIWIGGGITFGPTKLRNFAKKMNRRARRKALFMTLSDKVNSEAFVIVDDIKLIEGKTRVIAGALKALPLKGKRTLVVVDSANNLVRRALANLPLVESISPTSLNVRDVVKAGTIVVGKSDVDTLVKHYLK